MTALSFLNLDQGITQMRLAEGSVNFASANCAKVIYTK